MIDICRSNIEYSLHSTYWICLFLFTETANDRRRLLWPRCQHAFRRRRADGCDCSFDIRDSLDGCRGHFNRWLYRGFRGHQ